MTRKLSVSYRQEKLTRKSVRNISSIPPKVRKELSKLAARSDSHIDYSDISELNFNKLGEPLIGRFYRPTKKQISIRMDADVLDWFKRSARQYQSLINQVCREYMKCHAKRTRK